MLGVLAYERKNCEEAVRHFELSGAQSNSNDAALWQYGNCLYELRRSEEAAAKFSLLLSLRASDAVRHNLGLALLDSKSRVKLSKYCVLWRPHKSPTPMP